VAAFAASDLSKFSTIPVFGVSKIEGVLKDVSQTAIMVAHCRSFAHSLGYVNDPIVASLLPIPVKVSEALALPRAWLMGYVEDPIGIFGWIAARTNVIDSFVMKGLEEMASSASSDGASLVILGAGFDTRAYRLAIPPEIALFEVDTAPTQSAKRKLLLSSTSAEGGTAIKGANGNNVTYVPVDFNNENFMDRVIQEGFDAGKPAVIVWEGVIPYLNAESINSTLETVAKRCARGSVLIITFVNEIPTEAAAKDKVYGGGAILEKIAKLGEPSAFQMPIGAEVHYMESFGFHVLSHLNSSRLEAMYFESIGDRTRVAGLFNVMALETT